MAIAKQAQRDASDGISFLRADRRTGLRAGPTAPTLPLVLLHGIGSNAQSFAGLMTRLADQRTVIAWDAPGYGASAPLAVEWPSADDYSDALAGLMDRLGIGKLDVLGHSLGALIAARFAVRHPQRVGRLILASPALGYGTAPGAPLAPAAGNRLEAMMSEGAVAFAATRGPRLVHARHDAALVAGVVAAMSEVKLPGYAQATRMLSCADLISDGAEFAMRTLVLVGAQDEVTPPANCQRLFDAIAAARPDLGHRFEIVADAGHAAPQERPEAVAQSIAAFAPATRAET